MNLRISTLIPGRGFAQNVRCAAVLLMLLTAFRTTADARDFSTSYARMDVTGASVDVHFTVNRRDLLAPDLAEAITTNYKLEAPEPPLTMAVRRQDTVAENVEVLELVYTFSHPVNKLHIVSTLDRVTPAGHSNILQIGEGDDARQAILNASSPSVEIDLEEKTFLATVWSFVKLGIAFVSLVFSLVLYLMASRWKSRFLTASSLSISALSFFWLIQRAL